MNIRLAFLADYPEQLPLLAQWHHEAFASLNPNASVEQRVEKLKSRLGRGPIPTTVIALMEETRVGSGSLVEYDMVGRENLSPWIASVYVRPKYHRQGIGSQLMQHLESMARELGTGRLYLFTPDMKPFYETIGWVVLEQAEYRGRKAIIMAKNLRHCRQSDYSSRVCL
jgi:predicted N-acetyltransferase YhbS